AKQSAMQYAYEEKLAALRAHLERVTSQKLVEQNAVDGQLAELARKQALLEARHAVLSGLVDESGGPSRTGSIKAPGVEPEPARFDDVLPLAAPAGKPTPLPDMSELRIRDSLGTSSAPEAPT